MKDDKNKEKPVQKYKPLTTCNICNIRLRKDRLDKHLQKVHNQLNGLNNNNEISETKIVNFSEVVAFINQEKPNQSQQQELKNETPGNHTKEETHIQSLNQPKKSPWREEKCQGCSMPIYIHEDWIKPLYFCNKCIAYRKKYRKRTNVSQIKTSKKQTEQKYIDALNFATTGGRFEGNRKKH